MSAGLILGISLDGAGAHPAAWREPDANAAALFTADHVVRLAQHAEAAGFDFVTLDDSFALAEGGPGVVRGQLDALLTLARVAPVTSTIGLLATVTTTHTEPFHISKNLATLDLVSGGRAGWLVQVSVGEAQARHFGRRPAADVPDLYAEAAEAIDVVRRLWDSWEDGAVIRDATTGRYIDRDRLHSVDFEGQFFSVRGPSITPRSPQGQPLVAVHVDNDHALAVAAAWADIIVIDAASRDDAAKVRARVAATVASAGRDPSAVFVLVVAAVLLESTTAAALSTRARLDERHASAQATSLDFAGTPDDLAALFADWTANAHVDGFVVRPALLPRTLEQFADEVSPLLRAGGLLATRAGATLRERFGLQRPPNRYAEMEMRMEMT